MLRRIFPHTFSSLLACTLIPAAAECQSPSGGPLDFLEPLIGTWTGDPAWVAEHPGMEALVPISFRWGPTRYSIVDHAGLPVRGQLFTVTLITWNPVSRRAEFLATQCGDSLAFRGYYEPLQNGDIRRTYDVLYPDGSVVQFRESFFFDGPDAFDWLTEWHRDGRWVPRRGTGDPEFRAIRRASSVDQELEPLERWAGRWEGGGGTSLSLEPGRGGRSFYVRSSRGDRTLQEGLLVWDPHVAALRSTEVEAGGNLRRIAWSVDGDVLVRIVERFDTEGRIQRWIERWTPTSDLACFDVLTDGSAGLPGGTRFCRAGAPQGLDPGSTTAAPAVE